MRLKGSRSEPLRPAARRVLDLLREAKRPMKAYDLIAAFSPDGAPVHPPTVYRALEQLQARGLAHRLTSISAFVACAEERQDATLVFLACTTCGGAVETQLPGYDLASAAGFRIESVAVEISGRCKPCQAAVD
jgi:Fur family zinc uptake transcriptional regulator